MSQKLVQFACLALLVTVAFGKDEIKDAETKKIVKAPPAKTDVVAPPARAAPIGSGIGASITCYQCNSATQNQEDCESSDLEALAKFSKPCSGLPKGSSLGGNSATAVQCRKIEQDVEGEKKRIIRECAYTDGEEEIDGKKRTGNKGIYMYFYTCNNTAINEPCNPATPQAILSFGALALVAIAQFFHRL